MRARLGSRAWQLVLLSSVIVLVAAGTGYATIPGAGNVFAGCQLKGFGTVRLIDTSLPARSFQSHCTVLESPVSWNQLGQTGAPGPAGPVGPAGPPGAGGAPGAPGQNGLNPATPVLADGDAGWTLDGATIAGGELVLNGGFDHDAPQGALGAEHPYAALPLLSSLKSLSFAYHRDVRNSGADSVSIHVTVYVNSSIPFANLVYNTDYNGDYQQSYHQNAMKGLWWSTRALPLLPQATNQAYTPIQDIQTAYPDARITQISIDNGDSSGGTTAGPDFSAGVDDVLIGLGSSFTRYDFGG